MASPAERSMSFGAVAGDYDRLRPGPPREAIDWLLPDRRDVVVDLAAGTGLLTRARFSRSMPVADIVDMLATYSGIITASPQVREAGRARAAAALAAEFPGAAELEVPMRSRCWRADRVSRRDGRQDH